MSAFLNVYLRRQDVIVVPNAGHGGLYRNIEPVLVVPPSEPALSEALTTAIQASRASEGQPLPDRPKKWIVLQRLKLKSVGAFYTDAAHCVVYEEGGRTFVQMYQCARDGRGFEPANKPPVQVDDSSIAATVLDVLYQAPRCNPAPKPSA
jgi:hypothetical protein